MFVDPGHAHVEGDLKLLDAFAALAWSRSLADVVVLTEHLWTRAMLDNVELGKRSFYRDPARFLQHVVRQRAKKGAGRPAAGLHPSSTDHREGGRRLERIAEPRGYPMPADRPRFNIWLNVFILLGIAGVAVVQARGVLPEDNVVVTGIAYFAGGAVGALVYAGLSDLRDRFVSRGK